MSTDHKRVYWHSRRGMLEIDLALMPFAEDVYPGLPGEQQELYKHFLLEEDVDIFSWLMGHKKPESEELQQVLDLVLAHQKQAKL